MTDLVATTHELVHSAYRSHRYGQVEITERISPYFGTLLSTTDHHLAVRR